MAQHNPAAGQAPAPEAPRRARKAGTRLYVVLLFVASVLVLNSLVGDRGLVAMLQARRQAEQLQQSLDQIRAENARLREEARRLREDPAAIEELARRELGLIKPGEKVFIIHDAAPPSRPPR